MHCAMADASISEEFIVANFSLLSDNDSFMEMELDGNVTQEDREQIQSIVNDVQAGESSKTTENNADFQGPLFA